MDTITNFRDLGGLKNKAGRTLQAKKLLRSGELSHVSEQEQESLLTDYQLQTVIDLRSQEEVTTHPDLMISGTTYLHIDIFEKIQSQGTSLSEFTSVSEPIRMRAYMNEIYQTMAVDSSAQNGFAKMIEQVLNVQANKSVLFHCFAGKDRTGVSAVLLLEMLQMPKEVIYTDYLETNKLRIKENSELIQQAKAQGASEELTDSLKIALTVESEFLDSYYQAVTENFGDMQNYLQTALHISPKTQQELQKQLLF
ncbi:MAG TPA: tyrosine-protein phosphatase [Candidatus Tetragenococcus pullicola]|nr:tyrosine-protein phosphatase [Candidatus Tetragenococcus pullicola]